MKQTMIISVCMLFSCMARAQLQTPLSLISTAGGIGSTTMLGKSNTVEWTIGETIIGLGNVGASYMTIGEQQADMNVSTLLNETVFNDVTIFPNPATGFVMIEHLPSGSNTIVLKDITGNTIQSIQTKDNTIKLSTANLCGGIYLLTISNNSNQQNSYKLSILNK